MDVEGLRKHLQEFDQDHLLTFWDELDDEEKRALYRELSDLDLDYATKSFERCVAEMNCKAEKLDDKMEPLPGK